MSKHASRQGRKRVLRVLGALATATLVSGLVPSLATSAPEDFVNGSGRSFAQVLRVGPTAGRLSLAPTIGLSLADYLSTVGRGEAKAADWAAIGVASPSLPDNTPAVKVDSRDEGSSEGEREIVIGGTDDSGNGGGLMELFARGTDAPFGESSYQLESFTIDGLIEVDGAAAHTTSGIVADGVRRSTAVVSIERIDLGGGGVILEGLRWEAVQTTTDSDETVEGSFSIGSAVLGGELFPSPVATEDLDAALEAINEALAPIGLSINRPQVSTTNSFAQVSPLSIDIADSPAGRQFIAPILEAAHPIREPLSDAFIDFAKQFEEEGNDFAEQLDEESDEPVPDLTVGVLAADLVVGILAGSSQLHIELGGVNAFTEGERFENPFTGIGVPPPVVGGGVEEVFIPGTEGTSGQEPETPRSTEPEVAELTAGPPDPGPGVVPGDRGGLAVAVGLVGLGVVLTLAAADWLRMRRREAMVGS